MRAAVSPAFRRFQWLCRGSGLLRRRRWDGVEDEGASARSIESGNVWLHLDRAFGAVAAVGEGVGGGGDRASDRSTRVGVACVAAAFLEPLGLAADAAPTVTHRLLVGRC